MKFDVIIVGAGHAGLEAAFACNKQNLKTALITLDEETIGLMPCNPSIGGPAKGIVTREIDCLGGIQANAADACQLQMKILNTSKGPGVWCLRAQVDKVAYQQWFKKQLQQSNIHLIIGEVTDLLIRDNQIFGVKINEQNIESQFVILTTGTYLRSLTFKGNDICDEGPDHFANAKNLSLQLQKNNISLIRLKTGTPPRIETSSIDFSNLQVEGGTNKPLCFSHYQKTYLDFNEQLPCFIIHTNDRTHQIIKNNLHKSAMYGGQISGIGPRYCPSIEDKVTKFNDKPRHQIFLEPESRFLNTTYLGGFSTSMPTDIQEQMVRTLPGLSNCKIVKYAYAIEYDAIDPLQLYKTLESKPISNLFFAGQINGTSGYEEAAAQGLIAALNVCNKFYSRPPLILKRSESYIGVMIDDITTKGISEPYRLLTSRAEYRLYLRNDNVQDRLIEIALKNNMINEQNYKDYQKSFLLFNDTIAFLKSKTLGMFAKRFDVKKNNSSLYDYLKRPEISLKDILDVLPFDHMLYNQEIIEKIDIAVKFDGYIKKQNNELEKINDLTRYKLSSIENYANINNLSLEAIDKLNKIKPYDLDQASRISGININDLLAIKFFLERKQNG